MNTDTQPISITASTTVQVPIDEAFRVFTEDVGAWWGADHHIIEAPLSHMVFEPFVGGNLYDVGTDGSECRFSRVLVYDRPHRSSSAGTSPASGPSRPITHGAARSR